MCTLQLHLARRTSITQGDWPQMVRRYNGSLSFDRTYAEYEAGFQEPDRRELWWGLDNIWRHTEAGAVRLLVYLVDWENALFMAEYSSFQVSRPTFCSHWHGATQVTPFHAPQSALETKVVDA